MTTSFENERQSPTSLARTAIPSLNVETGYITQSGGEATSPHTPNKEGSPSNTGRGNSAVANRALRVKTSTRETFLDDITPVDPARNGEHDKDGHGGRDSHDLSIPPRQVTRDSLVDHMLLSLDQFSLGSGAGVYGDQQPTNDEAQLYAAFGDAEPFATYDTSRPVGRPGHGYSYSSDYENEAARSRSRSSSQITGKARRSNSSSNFQSALERINSTRNNQPVVANTSAQRTAQGQGRVLHSRNGKGSKGSSANSFDLGYARVGGTQRWGAAAAHNGRSSSFDFGHERPLTSQEYHMSLRQNNVAPPFTPYDYDAAPTPTVPGGPRRPRPMTPSSPYADQATAAAIPPQIERKRSTKSSKSAYKPRADPSNGLGINFAMNDANRELPPLPAIHKEPAPAPLIGYGKSKELQASSSQTKDRPGFFRRVFGSSKHNSIAAVADTSSVHGSATSIETAGDRPGTKPQHIASQVKPQSQPKENPPPPPQKEQPHVLSKKPSSFFRRRKKSVKEAPPPVPVVQPLSINPNRDDLSQGIPLPSPVSSLRKIMNPYLNSPPKTEAQRNAEMSNSRFADSLDLDDDVRGFSPGYTPDKHATIRAVKPGSRDEVKPSTRDTNTSLDLDDSPTAERSRTFLQDSSDNDRSGSPSRSPALIKDDRAARVTSPIPTAADVARDMALVAEYERAHSKKSTTQPKPPRSFTDDSLKSPTTSSSNATKPRPFKKEEEWVVVTPTKKEFTKGTKDSRVWLEPTSSEEDLSATVNPELRVPKSPRSSGSTNTAYKSATSLPIVQIEGEEAPLPMENGNRFLAPDEPSDLQDEPEEIAGADQPSEIDRDRAQKIYDGNEEFVPKSKAAAWLGEQEIMRRKTLVAYMELYDFVNLNILAALRILCGRLVLKAESQQVDRILDAFSQRWCQCNPNHGFKIADVVHTICYSILLLNTDLHLADIDSKMTRSQFVKNTMPTVLRVIADSVPSAFDRPSILPGRSQTLDDPPIHSKDSLAPLESRASVEVEKPSWRGSMKPPKRADSEGVENQKPTPLNYSTPVDDCGPLVKAPFHGTLRTWEVQVEIVLKDFYNSIRDERLPLSAATSDKPAPQIHSQSSLSVFTNGVLRRTPSVLSKAPSEAASFNRSRNNATLGTGKWSTKNRSRARVYPSSQLGSSRTSLDDQSSIWSPSMSSSTWSKYSLGKTHTSLSVDSFGSSWPQGDYQQSIGFANALSQAIIREEVGTSAQSILSGNSDEYGRVTPLLEDESLGLYGAPWAKEGIVKHKHHLEATDKKAKDRNWNEVFAIVEKGYLTLFSFSSKSMRNKSKGKAAHAVVGGGNWQDNAENLGSFLLRQTIASALPPPGYSKARPHVFALSLPTGAVHLFQVGSPEIVKEYVTTANYWSARLSNHPLIGGISNIEYGWSDAIVNNALVSAINEQHPPTNGNGSRPSTSQPRPSLQSSLRSSLDQGMNGIGYKGRMPGDKVTISEWSPPSQSMRASNLMEQDQLQTLIAYVDGIEEELQKHNTLRSSMLLAYTPRSNNSNKAMANWEKKSSYLLREIVKFRTYIDTLQGAEVQKQKVYQERDERKAEMDREREQDMQEEEGDGDVTLKPE